MKTESPSPTAALLPGTDGCRISPPRVSVLRPHEVHVWHVSLDQPPDRTRHLARTLSPDEQQRAERFCFERDRNRFAVGRGMLRILLGACLDGAPDQLQFVYGLHGKPYLDPALNPDGVQFNLAHSDGQALLALTRDHEVGLDLERVRRLDDMNQIAARFFSIHECAQLRALPSPQQTVAFFNAWTRKEAYLKATGWGIAETLRRIEVSLVPGEPARLQRIDRDPALAGQWTLTDIDAGAGYAAALAIKAREVSFVYHTW